ncbi:uncharacterized protein BJX67DRAFT_219756 [Aspergillus lucknowensis]|uniref:Uncharacterized protein n=1 Tax=Aspergillus lucknowensis TaxID=176173 RepID=A0ABR4LIP7_9EURO
MEFKQLGEKRATLQRRNETNLETEAGASSILWRLWGEQLQVDVGDFHGPNVCANRRPSICCGVGFDSRMKASCPFQFGGPLCRKKRPVQTFQDVACRTTVEKIRIIVLLRSLGNCSPRNFQIQSSIRLSDGARKSGNGPHFHNAWIRRPRQRL